MSRKRRTTRSAQPVPQGPTAQDVAAELMKMLQIPRGATTTDLVPQAQQAALQQTAGWSNGQATPLVPGGWNDPLVPFGPGRPIRPAAIDPLGPDGRPLPRRSEYAVSYNLPGGGDRVIPWSVLRQLADGVGIIRKCVEIRKGQVTQLDWDFVPSESAFEVAMLGLAGTGVETDRAKRALLGDRDAKADQRSAMPASRAAWERSFRRDNAEQITTLKRWWARPDRIQGWTWEDWLGAALEEALVLDALSIYPRATLGGDLHSLTIIDGASIKPLLDHTGGTPQAPEPAYQQILHGFPRGEFTASTSFDSEYTTDTLIYRPRNRRVFTPYGFSPTEQAVQDVDLYMKRRAWMNSEYDDGVAPELLINVNANMTPDQLRAYETVFNDMLSGNIAERHRAKMLPAGFVPTLLPSLESRYKPDYDLFLIRMIGNAFDITSQELGFPPSGGLGGAGFDEGDKDRNERRALRPTARWVSSLINEISTGFLGMPDSLEFSFVGLDDDEDDEAAESARLQSGRKTINESRDDQGLPRFDIPEADMPLLMSGLTIVPLAGLADRANAATVAAETAAAALAAGNTPGADDGGKPAADADTPDEEDAADEEGQPADGERKPADGERKPSKVPAPRAASKAATPSDSPACTCGTPIAWDDTDGWQHTDGSVSHDDGTSVSDRVGTTPPSQGGPQPVVVAAGLFVQAQSTGRVLLLQRALTDGDPAAGRWEAPGGCVDGVEHPEETARREWAEETGMHVPPGDVTGGWQTGGYVGIVLTVPDEDCIDLRTGRVTYNPDDPDGDITEALAWWAPADLRDNPAIRAELAASLDVALRALGADDAAKSAEAAAFRMFTRRVRKGERPWRPFTFTAHQSYIAEAANNLAAAGDLTAAAACLDIRID